MNVEQIYQDLQQLPFLIHKINDREVGAINELNRLHKLLYGVRVTANCSNCHIKAYHMLTSLTLQKLIDMNAEKFKLKPGVMIEFPYRSGAHYTAARGISDANAIAYLSEHPKGLENFSVYPGSDSDAKELDLSSFGVEQAAKLEEVKTPTTKAPDKPKTQKQIDSAKKAAATRAANKKVDDAAKAAAAAVKTEAPAPVKTEGEEADNIDDV